MKIFLTEDVEEEIEDDSEFERDELEEVNGHGARHIVTSVLLAILYAGLLYLRSSSAALTYLYALIPILILTTAIGTYVYNHDGDMKMYGAFAKLSSSGVALQILIDQIYSVSSSFSLLKYFIGFAVAFVFIGIYRLFRTLLNKNFTAYLMMGISVSIYLILLVFGYDPNGYGTTAWIQIGSYTVQLTDFTKVAAVLFYSALFSSKKEREEKEILILSSIFFLLNMLGSIAIHELGSFFILYFLHITILTIFMKHSKIKRMYLVIILAVTVGVLGFDYVLYKFMAPIAESGSLNALESILWPIVKKVYTRFSITANINQDPYGAGYQLLQGKKALWMAGFFGNTVNFTAIPVAESDMAYVAYVCSFGLVLGFYIFFQYLRIMLSGSELARKLFKHDYQDSVVVYGVTILIVLQAAIVILGSCNVIPFAGLPIPFLSRGGTYQALTFCFAGLLLHMSLWNGEPDEIGGNDDEETE